MKYEEVNKAEFELFRVSDNLKHCFSRDLDTI